jgi:hypothetical protein
VITDPFGVWIISEVISLDNNGIFTRPVKLFRTTERTVTVLRAVASWIIDLEVRRITRTG